MKKLWQSKEHQDKVAESMKSKWRDPLYREKMMLKRKEQANRPEYKEARSRLMKEIWRKKHEQKRYEQKTGSDS
jgi:hypothetical protein